jgi:hypothetical protein
MWSGGDSNSNLAEYAVRQSSLARVTVHSAVARLGDPDLPQFEVCGAILWRVDSEANERFPVYERMTPFWHLCPDSFVPIRKSKARERSLVAELAACSGAVSDSRDESVRIGTFIGYFRVDAFAWGSLRDGTRLVLSVFRPNDNVQSETAVGQ